MFSTQIVIEKRFALLSTMKAEMASGALGKKKKKQKKGDYEGNPGTPKKKIYKKTEEGKRLL